MLRALRVLERRLGVSSSAVLGHFTRPAPRPTASTRPLMTVVTGTEGRVTSPPIPPPNLQPPPKDPRETSEQVEELQRMAEEGGRDKDGDVMTHRKDEAYHAAKGPDPATNPHIETQQQRQEIVQSRAKDMDHEREDWVMQAQSEVLREMEKQGDFEELREGEGKVPEEASHLNEPKHSHSQDVEDMLKTAGYGSSGTRESGKHYGEPFFEGGEVPLGRKMDTSPTTHKGLPGEDPSPEETEGAEGKSVKEGSSDQEGRAKKEGDLGVEMSVAAGKGAGKALADTVTQAADTAVVVTAGVAAVVSMAKEAVVGKGKGQGQGQEGATAAEKGVGAGRADGGGEQRDGRGAA